MDSESQANVPAPSGSLASTPPPSNRDDSTIPRLERNASNASEEALPISRASDDQSLTSFPSLSASAENSPQVLRAAPSTPQTTRRRKPSDVYIQSHASSDAFEELFSPTRPEAGRSALFNDTPKESRSMPGTLHLLNDSNIDHLISVVGAVKLVKQLSEDLAQRDAQVTFLQRKAEERERILKKMLRDCEVSNLEIESKLKALDKPLTEDTDIERTPVNRNSKQGGAGGALGTRPDDGMDKRLSEAFDDSFAGGDDSPVSSSFGPSQRALLDSQATIKPLRHPSGDSSRSASSDLSARKKSASFGWRTYFGGRENTSKRSTSGAQARLASINNAANAKAARRGLGSDTFQSPSYSRSFSGESSGREEADSTAGQEQAAADAESVKSSNSVTTWALRLVGGGTTADANGQKGNASRSATVSGGTANGAPLANTISASRNASGARRSQTLSRDPIGQALGANGAAKRVDADARESSAVDDDESNYGPVEMDTILPDEKRPPTLVQHPSQYLSSTYLTDRFGFIYDQRRRRRQKEAAAAARVVSAALPKDKHGGQIESLAGRRFSMIENGEDGEFSRANGNVDSKRSGTPVSVEGNHESQPVKGWQDYLKLATFSTELLSHTPYAAPITSVTTAEAEHKSSNVSVSEQGSVPASSMNPEPAAESISADNAEFIGHSGSGDQSPTMPTDEGPVKALLMQLTDVHDALQRERTARWNEFLRKVRTERRRNGDLVDGRSKVASTPEVLMGDGELIGVSGLGNKGKGGRAKWLEFRSLVLGGIPVAYRAKVWAECCGASAMKVPGYYDELVNSEFHDPSIVQQIQMDITRTLTDNVFFREGQGVDKLREVLLAYARHNAEVGYCQGMNLITANLLLIMPTAEDAFWVLASLIEKILPEKYYDNSLLTSRADQMVLRQYVTELLPALSAHLEDLGIELEALTFQWFLSIFTDCLSAEALFRVWDVVLCINDGAPFLFQVALALLKLNEKPLLQCDNPALVYSYINQKMTDHAISIDGLIKASEGLKKEVRREDILKRRQAAVERELETARQREAIRKGKSRALDPPPRAPAAEELKKLVLEQQQVQKVVPPVVDTIASGKLTRRESALDAEDEAARGPGADLTVRAPMPVDEEAFWRA